MFQGWGGGGAQRNRIQVKIQTVKFAFFVISSKNYGVSQRFEKRPFVLHSGKQFTDVHA